MPQAKARSSTTQTKQKRASLIEVVRYPVILNVRVYMLEAWTLKLAESASGGNVYQARSEPCAMIGPVEHT